MHEVSVVIPCHTEKRLDQLMRTVKSVDEQAITPVEVVIVVDHNDALYEHLKRTLPGVTVLANLFARGVSGNRNTGVLHAKTPLVALLDDDVRAHDGWLDRMLEPFADPTVIGAGSAIVPIWERPRPRVVSGRVPVGRSAALTRDAGDHRRGPQRLVGKDMVVRRDAFLAVGGFRVDFGKVDDVNRPEDTDLCLRMANATGGRWMYVPEARHRPRGAGPPHHAALLPGPLLQRGRGKVEMGRLNDGRESLQSERDYLRKTLPRGIGNGIADALRGRGLKRAAQAVAIIAGAGFAAAGGLVGIARRHHGAATAAHPVNGPDSTAGRELAATVAAEETV